MTRSGAGGATADGATTSITAEVSELAASTMAAGAGAAITGPWLSVATGSEAGVGGVEGSASPDTRAGSSTGAAGVDSAGPGCATAIGGSAVTGAAGSVTGADTAGTSGGGTGSEPREGRSPSGST